MKTTYDALKTRIAALTTKSEVLALRDELEADITALKANPSTEYGEAADDADTIEMLQCVIEYDLAEAYSVIEFEEAAAEGWV
jgi:hypothetical protein